MGVRVSSAAGMALVLGAVALGGCDGMVDLDQMYTEYERTCTSSAAEQGVPVEIVEPFCQCTGGKMRDQEFGPTDMLDTDRVTAIAQECMNEIMAGGGASEGAAPEANLPAG